MLARVRETLAELLALDPLERDERFDSIVGEDDVLRAEVLSVLAELDAADADGFLDGAMPDDRASSDPLPSHVGGYEIEARIGAGSSATVYRARAAEPLARVIALKVLRTDSSRRITERFRAELRSLASFRHPNIAQVYDAGFLPDGRPWCAGEFVDGDSITEVARRDDLDWRARVVLVQQAAEAIHHAHQRGVIHRDLKPSNLLVERDESERLVVKVIDFGVALRVEGDPSERDRTADGLIVGTLAYMAPEQLRGNEVDARTDVYALGLVLFELLARRPARRTESGGFAALIAASEQAVVEPLPSCEGFGRDLEAIVACATSPDPSERYPSAQHFADDIVRMFSRRPVRARPASTSYTILRWIRRHPVLLGSVAAALLAMTALAVQLERSRWMLAEEVAQQHAMLGALVGETLDGLSVLRGTTATRESMVESLLTRTTRMRESAPDDRELRSVHARLLRERGDLAGTRGDLERARAELAASRDLYAGLSQDHPESLALGRRHAEAIVRVGDLDRALGRPDATRAAYERARAIQEALLARFPNSIPLRDDLCWSYDRATVLLDPVEDAEQIEDLRERRLVLAEAMLAADPDRTLSWHNLSSVTANMSESRADDGRFDEALALARRARAASERCLAAEPDRTAFILQHRRSRRLVADYRAALGIVEDDEVRRVVDSTSDRRRDGRSAIDRRRVVEHEMSLLAESAERLASLGEIDLAVSLAREVRRHARLIALDDPEFASSVASSVDRASRILDSAGVEP